MKKIAIVGSGISGLSCAHLLKKDHDVHLFESEATLGGHTNTLTIDDNGIQRHIDTGFIVFNDWNYPNFFKLMDSIEMGYQKTEMSFSVHNPFSHFEYNGNTLATLFSQKKNIVSPKFWHFLYEITRFNRLAKKEYQANIENTNFHESTHANLLTFLDTHRFSDFFRQHYILPMGAAIWSMSLKEMESFPLHFFIRFFYHHGLLNINNRPQWYVINNGSESYIEKLIDGLQNIHLSTPVTNVKRDNGNVEITFIKNNVEMTEHYDDVILACHSDQALNMLADPSEDEQQVLSNMRYQQNDIVLHQDERLMPNQKASWASWNYRLTDSIDVPACVTYYMNKLQNLPSSSSDFFVTLNQTNAINPDKIISHIRFSHPTFDTKSMIAQNKRDKICGKNNTHFCGAYWYNGFHEDGLKSALDVCKKFNITL